MKKIPILLLLITLFIACTTTETKKASADSEGLINETIISAVVDAVKSSQPAADQALLGKGVKHAASLWRAEDGSASDFTEFVKTNYIADRTKRKVIFNKISSYFESIYGNFNEVSMDLKKILDEDAGEIDEVDRMFGNYSVGAHLQDDFYGNKIAFIVALNFPYYTLAEKEQLGPSWSREEWAMSRMGDIFVARVPADVNQVFDAALGDGEMYIAEYNIHMGHLRTDDGRQLFPDEMVLLSHWNLRDELKADYTDRQNGLEKQEMILKVMERIINQDIPKVVINNPEYEWAPYSNKVTKAGTTVVAEAEPDKRYQLILNIFKAHQAVDKYFPEMNTAILRKFSWEMEIAQPEVEELFDTYMKSPQLKSIASIIRERLGRDLKPFDVWYDGFKSRSSIPEELLTSKTSALYPGPDAFEAGMPAILVKLGWSPERAKYLAGKIVVDPARGSGHAAGAAMKGSLSHLRTRISEKGMDYKGYNIAVHEFGHNVEQTISLYDVDNYMMSGVPNTACTEAMAYVFQSRDLILLGMKDENPEKVKMETLDAAWDLMEIMGVGMIEMRVWKWLYENPGVTAAQFKKKMIETAVEVWNEYFAPVIGVKDSPLLAIYSHMVNTPLYLPNYSYGRIIHFQVEEYLQGKNLTAELDRIFKQGRLTPQQWMMGAVGSKISTQPLLNKLDEVLK
ncbi:MAG: hypothetical protein MUF36_08930 [Bacteroidales bacterium]|jgi:hypothetical protein|nr:hypothetical protein [Bacteroidales bacterium]